MRLEIGKEIAALEKMSTGQLGERYAELFGETTRTRHRAYLVRKIAWKLQALAEGDLSERARRRAEELAQGTELRVMAPKSAEPTRAGVSVTRTVVAADPRLPTPGTEIVRQYKSREVRVLVLAEGFEFEGQRYKSLSAFAKKLTGSHINGFRFFGLEGEQ